MATKAWMEKVKRKPKFASRTVHRCPQCGRVRGFLTRFKLCRICFRSLASEGFVPGVTKASW